MSHNECPTCGGPAIDVIDGLCNACRAEGATYRATNLDRVVDVMEYSKFGPLAQVFVMEAILRYAEQVANATPTDLTPEAPQQELDGTIYVNMGVQPQAWIGVAKEVLEKLTTEQPTCGPCGL